MRCVVMLVSWLFATSSTAFILCLPDDNLTKEEQAIYLRGIEKALAKTNIKSNCFPRQTAKERVRQLLKKAEKYHNTTIPEVPVEWRMLGTASGVHRCNSDANIIFLNELIFLYNYEEFLATSVPHEVAHAVECHLNGKHSGHGEPWQEAYTMLLGIKHGEIEQEHSHNCFPACLVLYKLVQSTPERKISERFLGGTESYTQTCLEVLE